tara:strand:+ start:114 stop:443 length:330 start_codon:yes stop_codon:yes gene_type:complete
MNSLEEFVNGSNDKQTKNEKNLILYIEQIQKKFSTQIDQLNFENEKLSSQNIQLKNQLKASQEYSLGYFNQLSNMQECLNIQIETNNNLLKIIKDHEGRISYKLFNLFG